MSDFDPARICVLLERAENALNDWVATYASDMCGDDSVRRAWDRIGEGGGTLCYAASLMSDLHAARICLASVDTRPEGGDGTAPFTSGTAPKADAKIPNDYNAQSPLPAPPDNQ